MARRCLAVLCLLEISACATSSEIAARHPSHEESPHDPNASRRRVSLPTPFGAIPIAGNATAQHDWSLPYTIELLATHADTVADLATSLAEHARIDAVTPRGLRVTWDYIGHPSTTPPKPADRTASFVIDYDEPSVQTLVKTLAESSSQPPTAAKLTEIVASHIQVVEHGRFDVASRVAQRGAGDCTEHAVLLAALGRARGIPSRVVFGYLLLPNRERAIGHTWTEMHDGRRWAPFDATSSSEVSNLYLKLWTLEDETVGYPLSMLGRQPAIERITMVAREAPSTK